MKLSIKFHVEILKTDIHFVSIVDLSLRLSRLPHLCRTQHRFLQEEPSNYAYLSF